MKTKIFVCGNSGIDYVQHSENISSIPVIIKFSEEEKYLDYIDINNEVLFTRLSLDKSAKASLLFLTHQKIKEYIDKAYVDGYERCLIILGDKRFSDLEIAISIALANETRLECHIYKSSISCLPLSYLSIVANDMLTAGETIENVISRLEYISNNSKVYFFVPKIKDENSKVFLKKYEEGKIYELADGKIIEISKEKGQTSFEKIIKLVSEGINNENEYIPFLLYPTKASRYIELFGDMLIDENVKFKKMKYYPISASASIVMGVNSVALGYILK